MNARRVGVRTAGAAALVAALCMAGPGFADGIGQGPHLGGAHVGQTDGPGGSSGQGSGGGSPSTDPDKPKSLLDTLAADASLSQFAAALKTAGLEATLKGTGPYTVFAPSDMAFLDLDAERRFKLLSDKTKLKSVLGGHIVSGKLKAADVDKAAKLVTLGAITFEIKHDAGKPSEIAGAKIVTADIVAANGIIHVIDKILLAPEKPAPAAKPPDAPAAPPK